MGRGMDTEATAHGPGPTGEAPSRKARRTKAHARPAVGMDRCPGAYGVDRHRPTPCPSAGMKRCRRPVPGPRLPMPRIHGGGEPIRETNEAETPSLPAVGMKPAERYRTRHPNCGDEPTRETKLADTNAPTMGDDANNAFGNNEPRRAPPGRGDAAPICRTAPGFPPCPALSVQRERPPSCQHIWHPSASASARDDPATSGSSDGALLLDTLCHTASARAAREQSAATASTL